MRVEVYHVPRCWVSDLVRLEAGADGVAPSPGFERLEADRAGVTTSSDLVRLEVDEEGVMVAPDLVRLQAPEVEVVTPSPDFVRLEFANVEGADSSPPGFASLESLGVGGVDPSPPGVVSLEWLDVEGPPPTLLLWLLESEALPSVAVKYPELPVVAELARDKRIDPSCHTLSSSSFVLAMYLKTKHTTPQKKCYNIASYRC